VIAYRCCWLVLRETARRPEQRKDSDDRTNPRYRIACDRKPTDRQAVQCWNRRNGAHEVHQPIQPRPRLEPMVHLSSDPRKAPRSCAGIRPQAHHCGSRAAVRRSRGARSADQHQEVTRSASTTTKRDRADCVKAGAADRCSVNDSPAVKRREVDRFDNGMFSKLCHRAQDDRCN
jgi:hypothetical protein